ncbi:hypothetical protein ACF05L_37360 [Streptomyces bobili]|uniref:hypothetical protein n=1 Tax=Streptomyces bobili TaxID=67280 RepID=UPI0037022801
MSVSPWCDLEIANETVTVNAGTDKILGKELLEFFRDAWIGGTGIEVTDTRINLNRADLSGPQFHEQFVAEALDFLER